MEAGVINSEKEIQIVDKRLANYATESLQLHFEVENKLMKVHIFEPKEKEILAFELVDLSDFFKNSPLKLESTFQKVSLSLVTSQFTLVPSTLFIKEKATDYLLAASSISEGSVILTKEINFLNAFAVFAMPSTLKEILDKQFSAIDYFPHAAPTYLSLYNLFKTEKEPVVFVNIHSQHYDIIVFEDSQLKLFTVHPILTTEDFLYYSFYTLEQLKINAGTAAVYLMGEVEKNSAIHEILIKYFKKSSWILKSSQYKLGYELNDINPYFYFSHFSQYLCV
jgi:Protein of unknown function (DUF3822)